MKEHGLPVSTVFDEEIKDLPTSRFSKDFNHDYKILHAEIQKERFDKGHTSYEKSGSMMLGLEDQSMGESLAFGKGMTEINPLDYKFTENSEASLFLSERLQFSQPPSK